MDKSDSQLIKWLRFPLTLGIVCLHCMGNVEIEWGALGVKDIPGLVKMSMSGCFLQAIVPVFFFISGFLFFKGVKTMNKNCYIQKMHRRLYSLAIPYVLWIVLSIPLTVMAMYGETLTGTSSIDDIHEFLGTLTLQSVFWGNVNPSTFPNLLGWTLLGASPVLGTFWFVRDLIIISLLSPIVWWYVTKVKYLGLAILVIIHLFRIWPGLSVGIQILFFVYGAYWAINEWKLSFSAAKWRVLVYSFCIALLILLVRFEGDSTYWGFILMPFFTIVGVITILNLATQAIKHLPTAVNVKIMDMAKQSFFVYALHLEFALPIGFFITKKVLSFFSPNWFISTLQYLITPCVIYIICMVIYAIMDRFTPRILAVLTGNRV